MTVAGGPSRIGSRAWPWRPWLAGLGAFVVLAGTVNGTLLALQAQIRSGEASRRGDPRVERWLDLATLHHLKKIGRASCRERVYVLV